MYAEKQKNKLKWGEILQKVQLDENITVHNGVYCEISTKSPNINRQLFLIKMCCFAWLIVVYVIKCSYEFWGKLYSNEENGPEI